MAYDIFKQSIPLSVFGASRPPNSGDIFANGFSLGSIWTYGVNIYNCTADGVWGLVGGSITDLSGIPTSTATTNTLAFFDADKELISATDILLGTLGIVIQKEFTLDFDGIEDTFEKTHTYNNDYITYSIRKSDGSYYKETEYDVSSTTTTFTVVFITPPALGTGKLTLQSVQKEAVVPPSGAFTADSTTITADSTLVTADEL